ncbi:hypothetical protein [Stenotrophomonas pigmentata]|uniref:hypothetical protein n=1 Tax=Stenotrophomonas pigmentata TaxID=3055080 RepID=UPI0026EE0F2D|nr:hypothetical protein [Stenotrophomonas sp. 610A2]
MRNHSFALSALLVCIPMLSAQADEVGAASGQQPTQLVCNTGVSKALPGDYNFCLAQKYWDSGRYESARQMLELSAGWGNKAAQRALGVAYFNGDGLARDKSLGLAWLALAAERKEAQAATLYNSALDQSTEEERRAGALILAELGSRYSDDVAALRAESRFERSLRAMTSNPVYGRGQCLPGAGGLPVAAAFNQFVDGHGGCTMASDDRFLAALEKRYEVYSGGWSKKHVELGAPESMPVR